MDVTVGTVVVVVGGVFLPVLGYPPKPSMFKLPPLPFLLLVSF